MLEEWKKQLDKKYNAGAILTDLSKAFDSLSHDLEIARKILQPEGTNISSTDKKKLKD